MRTAALPALDWLKSFWEWETAGYTLLRIIIIFVIGRLLIWVVHKIINRVIAENTARRTVNQARRVTTVGKLLHNLTTYSIYFVLWLLVLSELGIHLGPLLAGAGIVGIAIGFGAQSLVKDILTGFFIIMEDQFAVGDVIQTGKFKGTVEMIGFRTTRLISWTGEVHILPNSTISDVTNYSIHNALAVVDVPLPIATHVESALQRIRETVEAIDCEHLLKAPQVLGVQAITAAEMTIRIVAECRANSAGEVTRLLQRKIKESIHEQGHSV